ncbi:uncharacterized protein EHS24_004209 [Apiotrichum porosum]|uniref:Uncharacterized protein n=1 Tax=Apiotrichum porosum TaxID=105984 RepID=A0A427Y4K7_9TREE|nr:uncharacterized protein EHS24_004209 [Apiotrichum porosum]RSH86012.1 hypothetical protein EHS24_004209 [Apiotrichum porosum]
MDASSTVTITTTGGTAPPPYSDDFPLPLTEIKERKTTPASPPCSLATSTTSTPFDGIAHDNKRLPLVIGDDSCANTRHVFPPRPMWLKIYRLACPYHLLFGSNTRLCTKCGQEVKVGCCG